MPIHLRRAALLVALAIGSTSGAALAQQPPGRATGPWDVRSLREVPPATWGEPKGLTREVFYEGASLGGKPTKVFGYYARPASGDGPFPAMLLVHGGGGHAFEPWAKLWAERGYVALAMDLSGRGPDRKRLADGGPDQDDDTKFLDFDPANPTGMWTYHAVAAVLKGHSLLASRPEVDASRIGVTGISWGGYLTCIVAGVDDRVKVAVPVYGCGFLHEDSYWKPHRFDQVPADRRDRWVAAFDPSRYLSGVTCPILFVNGTNDFAYPLGIYRKSYEAVPHFDDLSNPDRLCLTLRMTHGHEAGWAPKEIGLFVDAALKGGDTLAKLTPPTVNGETIRCRVASKVPVERARLLYAVDSGPWQERAWAEVEAKRVGDGVEATLPPDRPLVAFLNVVDARGAVASSPHIVIPPAKSEGKADR
jgi:dienelactone hydrolase